MFKMKLHEQESAKEVFQVLRELGVHWKGSYDFDFPTFWGYEYLFVRDLKATRADQEWLFDQVDLPEISVDDLLGHTQFDEQQFVNLLT